MANASPVQETGMPSFELATTQLQLNGHRFLRIDESIKIYSEAGTSPASQNEVQTLWLERNKISTIENLERFHKLTCLFLQSNFLQQIEGLEALKNLERALAWCATEGVGERAVAWCGTEGGGERAVARYGAESGGERAVDRGGRVYSGEVLNVSANQIKRVTGLASLPRLHTLLIAENQLEEPDDIAHLAQCTHLQELDLGENLLKNTENTMAVLRALPLLQVLTLEKNPVTHAECDDRITRRLLIVDLKELRCLDRSAIHPREREYTERLAARLVDCPSAAAKEDGLCLDEWPQHLLQEVFAQLPDHRMGIDGLPHGDFELLRTSAHLPGAVVQLLASLLVVWGCVPAAALIWRSDAALAAAEHVGENTASAGVEAVGREDENIESARVEAVGREDETENEAGVSQAAGATPVEEDQRVLAQDPRPSSELEASELDSTEQGGASGAMTEAGAAPQLHTEASAALSSAIAAAVAVAVAVPAGSAIEYASSPYQPAAASSSCSPCEEPVVLPSCGAGRPKTVWWWEVEDLREAAQAPEGEEEEEAISELPDLGNQTWRNEVVEAAQVMLEAAAFPAALIHGAHAMNVPA
eukprot:gene2397-3127_t